MANVSLNIVFEIRFLTLSDANINFSKKKLWWNSYIIKKALSITKQIELVGKKEFVDAALD